ncbi:hypothetical protein BRADI_4g07452v3 [Brachypodium distachyon]|uniref:Uncharacterized protein n=1 Tax=Brachypodium distachyon TaxID=15368 RepID=A0A0Q3IKH7_BRADI|nr:hypothetical protein BRADI_4g07452v3 [Brachypodium distachyon]
MLMTMMRRGVAFSFCFCISEVQSMMMHCTAHE